MSRYVDLDGLTWDGTKISSKIQEVKTKHGFMLQGITIGWLWGDSVPHIDLDTYKDQIITKVIENIVPTLYENDVDEEVINKCKRLLEQMKGEI